MVSPFVLKELLGAFCAGIGSVLGTGCYTSLCSKMSIGMEKNCIGTSLFQTLLKTFLKFQSLCSIKFDNVLLLNICSTPHEFKSSKWVKCRQQLSFLAVKESKLTRVQHRVESCDYSDNSRPLVTSATGIIYAGRHGAPQHLDSFSDCTLRARNCVTGPSGRHKT